MKNEKQTVLVKYLKENPSLLNEFCQIMASHNGACDDLLMYENDRDFFETYFGHGNQFELVEMVQRGVVDGSYDTLDDYVKVDMYGDLVSMTEKDYFETLLDNVEEITDNLIEIYDEIEDEIEDEDLKELLESK